MNTYNTVLAALLPDSKGHAGWVCVEEEDDWAEYHFDLGLLDDQQLVLILNVYREHNPDVKIAVLDADGYRINESDEFDFDNAMALRMTQHTFK